MSPGLAAQATTPSWLRPGASNWVDDAYASPTHTSTLTACSRRSQEHAREAIVGAQHEARDTGHRAVQVEHLLLGLFLAEDDIVSRVWADLALTIQPVRDMVRERLGVGPGSRPEGLLPFSPTAKDALRSAHRLGMGEPGTEHMLLVLLARGAVSEILTALGADPDRVRFETKKRAWPASFPSPGEGPRLVLETIPYLEGLGFGD
jgi:hypothetical protein